MTIGADVINLRVHISRRACGELCKNGPCRCGREKAHETLNRLDVELQQSRHRIKFLVEHPATVEATGGGYAVMNCERAVLAEADTPEATIDKAIISQRPAAARLSRFEQSRRIASVTIGDKTFVCDTSRARKASMSSEGIQSQNLQKDK